jgi:hypothetical protein
VPRLPSRRVRLTVGAILLVIIAVGGSCTPGAEAVADADADADAPLPLPEQPSPRREPPTWDGQAPARP